MAALAGPVSGMAAFAHWPPLAIACDLWAEGGIGPARLAVMDRVEGAKSVILGRANDRASGVAFVAVIIPVTLTTGLGEPMWRQIATGLVANAILLGRELTDMAWLRHESAAAGGNPAGKAERFLLGASVAGLMLVPVLGLIGPVVGAAAGTHLVLRRLDKEAEA